MLTKPFSGFVGLSDGLEGYLEEVYGGGEGVFMCFMTIAGGFHQKNCQINAS